jgi:PleD family two-component response regulator
MTVELLSRPFGADPLITPISILIADDEPTIVQVISRFLGREGFSVDIAVNGQEALEKIYKKSPDVLLLDVKMPVLDGLSVCEKLRSDFRTRGLPIILLTGNGTHADRLVGYKTGADDYLTKPFYLDELKLRIECALQRRRWDQGTHPLTHLPGSPVIEEEVHRRLGLGEPFAFAYIDVDHFKTYNDAYGYEAGDRVIKEIAELLVQAAVKPGVSKGFPAHVGGDDFVFIAPLESMKATLPGIMQRFDALRPAYYRPQDLERGSIRRKNRQGLEQEFPLIALSAAVVSTQTRKITHYARLVEIASELKGYIKSLDHHGQSLCLWDRRTDAPYHGESK